MFDVLPVPMQPSTVRVVTGSRFPPKRHQNEGNEGYWRAQCQTASRLYINLSFFMYLKVRALGFRMSSTTAL